MKILFLFLLAFFFNNSKAQQRLDDLKWICGTWEYKTQHISITEKWKQLSDTLFAGYSYSIQGIDTVSSEIIEIIKYNNKLQYRATVKGQNGGSTIPFLMTFQSHDSIVFENALHDFPQKISYKFVSESKICATIEGTIEGKLKKRDFFYERKK